MANDISTGVAERVLYGAVVAATAKLVERGYMTADMQMYVAGGAITAFGGVWAWWQNRPGRLMDRAAAQMPPNAKLVITTEPGARRQEKDAAHELAASAGANVVAKVTV